MEWVTSESESESESSKINITEKDEKKFLVKKLLAVSCLNNVFFFYQCYVLKTKTKKIEFCCFRYN